MIMLAVMIHPNNTTLQLLASWDFVRIVPIELKIYAWRHRSARVHSVGRTVLHYAAA